MRWHAACISGLRPEQADVPALFVLFPPLPGRNRILFSKQTPPTLSGKHKCTPIGAKTGKSLPRQTCTQELQSTISWTGTPRDEDPHDEASVMTSAVVVNPDPRNFPKKRSQEVFCLKAKRLVFFWSINPYQTELPV